MKNKYIRINELFDSNNIEGINSELNIVKRIIEENKKASNTKYINHEAIKQSEVSKYANEIKNYIISKAKELDIEL